MRSSTRFAIAAVVVEYDLSKEAGSRVISVKIDGKDLDPKATYKFATTDFLATGGTCNGYFQGPTDRP